MGLLERIQQRERELGRPADRWDRARVEYEDIVERNPHLRPRVRPAWLDRLQARDDTGRVKAM